MQSYVRSIWEECLNMISCLRLIFSNALEQIGARFVPQPNSTACLPPREQTTLPQTTSFMKSIETDNPIPDYVTTSTML